MNQTLLAVIIVLSVAVIGIGWLMWWNSRPAKSETHSRIYNEWWKKG